MKLLKEYTILNALGFPLLHFPTDRYTKDHVRAFYDALVADKEILNPVKLVAIDALGEQHELSVEDL